MCTIADPAHTYLELRLRLGLSLPALARRIHAEIERQAKAWEMPETRPHR